MSREAFERPGPSATGLKDRRYWVEVRGDVAQYLDGMGLMIRCLDKAGVPKMVPTFQPDVQDDAAMLISQRFTAASKHLGSAPKLEFLGSKVEGDLGGPHLSVTADQLVELVIQRVIDALRMSDPTVPRDVELGTVDGPGLDVKDHFTVDQQPGVDDLVQGVDPLVRIEDGAVSVNFQPGHDSSPSVGAPTGAVCDNPNPTDGELNPGAATSPNGAAPARTQTEVQE